MKRMMINSAYNEYSINPYSYSGCTNFEMTSTIQKQPSSLPIDVYQGTTIEGPYEELSNGKYNVFAIANWFLLKESMSHKKLQKLCYYAQAWFYALKDIRLSDTVFEAWTHGPVSPVLYDKFKSFGYSPIRIASDYTPEIQDEDLELLESVWTTYGDHTGNALEALSHSELPWLAARKGYAPGEKCKVVISPDTMKSYYRSIYIGGDA